MPKVIVTGAAGFIGSHIARQLLKDGHTVLAIDDLSGGSLQNIDDLMGDSNFYTSTLDCRNESYLGYQFDIFQPDYVYHLAANARESASFFQPISVVSRNVSAYVNVITHAIRCKVKRIVVFSSIAAYGHQFAPFTENMALLPADVYGLSKKYMEDLTVMLAKVHGIEYVIFRPHNVFGEGQALDDPYRNVIAIWMNKIMHGEPLVIFGDGEQKRAFSYIENSLPCYMKAMTCQPNEIFNIGSDQVWTIKAMAKLVISAMSQPDDYSIEYLPERYAEVKFAHSSHVKAKEILGLTDEISVTNGIRRMAKWAIKHGPQDWKIQDKLEITNELTPRSWVK